MTVCPNCGVKLHFTDWKPNCPSCGVNLNYYHANEILLEETEKAEREHALFQPKVDRAKAAYAGDKRAILRIVFTLMPVGALFLPLYSFGDGFSSVLDLGKVIASAGKDGNPALFDLLSSWNALIPFVLLGLSAVLILINLIFLIMSLGKHGKGRTAALYGLMCLSAVSAVVCFAVLSGGTPGVGAYLYAALQAWSFLWTVLLLRRGIPVRYTPCVIGGLPAETYFSLEKQGIGRSEIRRKMLIALTEQQIAFEEKKQAEQEKEAGDV